MSAATEPAPPLKPSRYRAIRGKNVPESRRFVEPTTTTNSSVVSVSHSNDAQRLPIPTLTNGNGEAGVNGGMNKADAVGHAPLEPPPSQQQQQSPGSTATMSVAPSASPGERSRYRTTQQRPSRLDTSLPAPVPAAPEPMSASAAVPTLVPLPSARARGMLSGADQHEVLLADGVTLEVDEVARREAEAERLLAEQKRKDLERLERELENHQSAASNLPPKSPSRDKLSFLTRRRGISSAAPATPTATTFTTSNEPLPYSPEGPNGASSSRPTTTYSSGRDHSGSEPPPHSSTATTATSASPTAVPQQMDAPSSAPGSGANKHIIVRCRQFSVNVPITPESTVGDALDVATELLPRAINLNGCALVESYTRLGLERRLRRYERIKDIMGSWDTDNDNAFVVMLSEASGAAMAASAGGQSPKEKKGLFSKSSSHHEDIGAITSSNSVGRNGHTSDLELSSVSRSRSSRPPGFVFMSMYHSQKPGRWNKRFITLVEETGQMVASKKADESRLAFLASETSNRSGNSNNNNSDFQNLCHLSDYDIYTPTEAQMRKNLRPPKTYCFAVKSQQRTTVFLNTDNYVHFFSTDDAVQARMFYDRVFGWRSWYLVNRHLSLPDRNAASKKKKQEDEQQQRSTGQAAAQMPPSSSATLRKNTLQRSLSRRSASNAAPIDSHARFSTVGSLFGGIGDFDPTLDLDRSEPPAAAATPDPRTRSLRTKDDPSIFTPGGLLGNSHDTRRRADSSATQASSVRDRERHHHQSSNGSFKGLSAAVDNEAPWFPSASEHTAQQRTNSIREGTPSSSRPQSTEDIPLGLQFPQLLQQQQQQQRLERDASMSRSRSVRRTMASTAAASQQPSAPPVPPNMPAPLIDLTPKFKEAPQWSKEGKGHGVRAPVGTAHLVDLATDSKTRMTDTIRVSQQVVGGAVPPPSNANLLRRDQPHQTQSKYHSSMSGNNPASRSQTMTTSSVAVAAGFSRSRSLAQHGSRATRGGGHGGTGSNAPPVPLLSLIPGGVPLQEGAASAPTSRDRSAALTRN
ncbi:uncharacterized protein SPSK_05891 [Sporothrix schenckii 1099-18]|uniref:PH domain-containing protein n=1 Tax=Sporothrix schenckii 1099-18 TaxID=1397361 RepID=A0A0F2MJS5_SPOSC|nr:uncharacterized protein SPSK_05891 [Sporothrix schenckii 1099-18]KJR89085.1 hypothetical protein SPSK_05891 [Sporothrix schenckii 1099-18]